MQDLSTYALADVLDAFASGEPVPGGGSAAALVGALGASLLLMVAGLPRTRTNAPEEVADVAAAAARLRPLRDTLLQLVNEDAAAYSAVIQSYNLPTATDADQQARRNAIDAAMQKATDAPIDVMRACQQALRGAAVVAACGARSASSDLAVALELLTAAIRGSGMNVDANLRSIQDAAYQARIAVERRQLEADAHADVQRARELLDRP